MPDLSQHNPTGRFSGLADIYAKSRPSYPDAALEYIVKRCQLQPNDVIADVGAGTGISSRQMAVKGFVVIGVEPNDEMRTKAEAESITFENLSFHKGSAEDTMLSDHAVDMVLCAQAFHWFKPENSLKEFSRILKPHKFAVLMWNERDEEDSFTGEYGALFRSLPDTVAVEGPRGTAGQALMTSPLFHDQQLVHFTHKQEVDFPGLVGRAFSASYAPREQDAADRFTESLRTIFDKYAVDNLVSIAYQTSVYSGRSNNGTGS